MENLCEGVRGKLVRVCAWKTFARVCVENLCEGARGKLVRVRVRECRPLRHGGDHDLDGWYGSLYGTGCPALVKS